MSAVFGYSKEYVQWDMTLLDVYCHIDYIVENPPAGRILKAIVEAFGSGDKKDNRPASKPQQEPGKLSRSLEGFIADFTGAGGSIK